MARALWLESEGRARLRQEPAPHAGPGEVIVRASYSGISRGTERLVFDGRVPPGQWQGMRGPHMQGSFDFPLKYGYAVVGEIVDGMPDRAGQAVFCLHPHQDVFSIPLADAVPVPEGLPHRRAVLAANMETALNIVWDANILPGDRVAVFGAGVVGCLVAYLAARIPATDVIVIDRQSCREETAHALGIAFARSATGRTNCDVVVNVTGSGDALCEAMEIAGFEARIVEASWYGSRPAELSLGGAFHSRRLTIASSQVGSVCPSRAPRWPSRRRLETALALLADARLDCLVAGQSAFDSLDTDYAGILADPSTLCHCVRY
ncbi:zinc-binding alcohol dehydrogenase [Aureimonas altamirensis]|uniref:zinc-dependent alcohol dehydrogenase n=1 Tax=Aureimonas altamirensis TaxID=370622 RepID=UPI002036E2A3|nr:zinc-binding alcohol dehydrogenase [Aureimonas altamirensis]MCM2502158.1 zinc-binding alcohol dehydrogenase [Aureimonas altamirensis]